MTDVRQGFLVGDPLGYFEVNVGGTVALLTSLSTRGPVPVVMASSGAVYGAVEGHIAEDHPAMPTNPYGASKLAAEQLLGFHAANGLVGATVLRCFNVAGAVAGVGDRDLSRIIPKALAVARGEADRVHINGDGKAVREFTHVADVARAFSLAVSATAIGESRTYNVGSAESTTMLDVVEAVERVTGRPIPVEHGPAKSEPAILVADSTRIREKLGWQPHLPDIDDIVRDAWRAMH